MTLQPLAPASSHSSCNSGRSNWAYRCRARRRGESAARTLAHGRPPTRAEVDRVDAQHEGDHRFGRRCGGLRPAAGTAAAETEAGDAEPDHARRTHKRRTSCPVRLACSRADKPRAAAAAQVSRPVKVSAAVLNAVRRPQRRVLRRTSRLSGPGAKISNVVAMAKPTSTVPMTANASAARARCGGSSTPRRAGCASRWPRADRTR